MGTHPRLGMSSALRLLAGEEDALRLIAAHAELHTAIWLARPPPKELPELRRHLRLEHGERMLVQHQRDDALVEIDALRTERDRALRRAASEAQNAARWHAQFDEFARELQADCATWQETEQRRWQQLLKQQRAEAARAACEAKGEYRAERISQDERYAALEARYVALAEDQEGDRRGDLWRYRQNECEARRLRKEAEQRFQREHDAATRLRSARNASALEKQAALEQQLRELKKRRTLNQRRVSDANLAYRRACVAQEQSAAAQAALYEYCVEDAALEARAARLEEETARLAREAAAARAGREAAEMQVASLQGELQLLRAKAAADAADMQAELDRLRSIAEPTAAYFKQKTSSHAFTAAVDLAIIEALCLGVARNKVPALFNIFARFYRIKLPGRSMKVPGKWVDGKRQSVERFLLYIPSATHVKEMAGVMNQLNKLQVGQWLLDYMESDAETSCCYIADGAESQQRDFLAQMLARRIDGKLELMALDLAQLKGKSAEAQAAAFNESLESVVALMEKAGLADGRAAALLRRFLPTCTQNDRASTARRAAALILGLAADSMDFDPTCAEHGLVNILEEGRKGMDAVLRAMMNITEEQAEGDAAKVKAMRTCVGWFSSPACALIYQVTAARPSRIGPDSSPAPPKSLLPLQSR